MSQPRRQKSAAGRLTPFIGLAVLIHLASAPVVEQLIPEKPDARPKPIRIVSLPSGTGTPPKVRRPTPEEREKKRKAREEREDKEASKLEGQVVDIPASPDDTAPEEYDYLSEHNTRTERETRSRHASADRANTTNERTVAKAAEASSPSKARAAKALEIGPEQPLSPKEKKVAGEQAAFELPTIKQRDRLALNLDPELGNLRNQTSSQRLDGNSDRLKLALGEENEKPQQRGRAPVRGPATLELLPNVGVLAQINGAPANDHLDDLEEGEGTFLNSREFKFASFFNRMKRGVSQHWRPLQEYRRRDPTGNVYGQRSRVTVLQVTLKPDGSLVDVEVSKSSGVDFLDHEAVTAFRRAQPFPNPPHGLVDGDTGNIAFPFGFHIEFSRRGGLRLPF